MKDFHPVTHVIFDLDGLLLDTGPLYNEIHSKVLAKYGKEYTLEAKRAKKGQNARDGAKTLISLFDLPITVENYLQDLEELYEEVFRENVKLMPGAERLVKHLKETNVPICIATSSGEKSFQLKAKHHEEFLGLFDHIVHGSDTEVKQGKPAPDIFLVAARRFGKSAPTDLRSVLVFEDSTNGVMAGIKAGMQVVWVPAPSSDIKAVEATTVIPSLDDFNPELFGLIPYSY